MTTMSKRPPWVALYDDDVPATFEPTCKNAVEVFERGPRERPDAPAIYYFDQCLTFAEAAAEAHSLAVALRDDLGVKLGDRVAVMLQNVPQVVIAVHAIWLAGAVVTPVNVMNKKRELEHQFSDAPGLRWGREGGTVDVRQRRADGDEAPSGFVRDGDA